MRKTDKKIENALRLALTDACDLALDRVAGFCWLTHTVNYNAFPQSLQIVCVFATDQQLAEAVASKQDQYLRNLIKASLRSLVLTITDNQIKVDTEEACERNHQGNWAKRIQ